MKTRLLFGTLFIAAISFTSCNKHNGCSFSEKAWVRDFSDTGTETDTCGIVFELEDGTKLEPTNLAEFSGMDFEEGKLVWISYKEASGASTCGIGDIVKIRCVVDREY